MNVELILVAVAVLMTLITFTLWVMHLYFKKKYCIEPCPNFLINQDNVLRHPTLEGDSCGFCHRKILYVSEAGPPPKKSDFTRLVEAIQSQIDRLRDDQKRANDELRRHIVRLQDEAGITYPFIDDYYQKRPELQDVKRV